MTNYTKTELGKLENLETSYQNGKAFLHDALNLTSCEISLNTMKKNTKLPFSHKHKQNEEIYIFVKGEGRMVLDDTTINFKEGSCIKVLPQVKRTMETDTDTIYICIQAKTGSLEQFAMDDAELC